MPTITFYNVSKKVNSTLIPSAGLAVSGSFRAPVDILNPVVAVEQPTGQASFATSYNYAFITDTNRYYWITGKTAINETLWEISFAHDPLANYKTQIGASEQYVVRAASTFNGEIKDNLYPLESTQSVDLISLANDIPWHVPSGYQLSMGWYVIGVLNSDTDAIGSASYYALNATAFQSMRNALFSTTNYTNMSFSEIEEPLYKSLFNPMQYIVSCMWFPTKPEKATGSDITTIDCGWFSVPAFAKTGSEAYRVTDPVTQGILVLSTQHHPQATTRGAWLNTAPYTQRTLYIEPVGSIDLDTTKLAGANTYPALQYWIDYITGELRLRVVASGTGAVVGEGRGMLGVSVELAQQTQSVAGTYTAKLVNTQFSLLDTLGFERGGNIAGPLEMVGTSGAAPNVQSSGPFAGSLVSGKIVPYDITTFTYAANDDLADRGRPLCEKRVVNTLSGFIQIEDPQTGFDGCLAPERDAIARYMTSGFFYE